MILSHWLLQNNAKSSCKTGKLSCKKVKLSHNYILQTPHCPLFFKKQKNKIMTAMCFCKQVVGWYCTGKKNLVIFWFLSQYLKVLKSTGLKKVNQRHIAVLTYCQYLAGCFSQTDVVGNLGLYLCWISTNTHYWLLSGCPVFYLSLVARCLLLSLPGPDGRQPAGDHLHHQPPEQLWWILPRTALDPGACPAVPRLSRLHAFKEETNRGLGYGF